MLYNEDRLQRESAPNLHTSQAPLHLNFSAAKEIFCTCGSLKKTNPFLPSQIHQDIILSCNSLLDDNLMDVLQQIKPRALSIKMEVHLATATLTMWTQKILSLPKGIEFIVIIDKMDSARFSALKLFDDRVSEYRVLASKVYPMELFVKDLPPFILKKLQWVFRYEQDLAPSFLSIDELHKTLQLLSHIPLTPLSISSSSHYEPIDIYEHHFSNDFVWISSQSVFSEDTKRFLKNQIHSLQKNHILSFVAKERLKLAETINIYRRDKSHHFYFLENCLVPIEIWADFKKSHFFKNADHFSWNEFIVSRDLIVDLQSAQIDSSPLSLQDFANQCCQRYARLPIDSFYNDFFCFFSPHIQLRHKILRGLQFTTSLTQYESYQKAQHYLPVLGERIKNFQFEVIETQHVLQKISLRALNRSYWGLHRALWMIYQTFWFFYEMMWRLVDVFWLGYRVKKQIEGSLIWRSIACYWAGYRFLSRVYSTCHKLMWHAADMFWLVYKYAVSPVIGFTRSLFDQPPEWNAKLWPERWFLRCQHIAKKMAWLILKILRLR